MPSPGTILTPDRGTAHTVALGVLCALVVVQIAAVGRAVWLGTAGGKANPSTDAPAGSIFASPPVATPGLTPPPTVPLTGTSNATLSPPIIPSTASAVPSMPTPAATVTGAFSSNIAIDPKLDETLQIVQQLRPLGDLQSALDLLKKADGQFPDHPVVLHEMAQTYDQMGLTDKALTTWRRLESLGARAGEFQTRATQRLSSLPSSAGAASLSPVTGLTTPPTKALDTTKSLGLGFCQITRDPVVTSGEKLTLRIPILSHAPVNPDEVNIDVFFFDLVNGEKVEQTRADDPIYTWAGVPVDWAERQEVLDVTYHMPVMSADQLKNYGKRKFHGYIVKLYHQNKLMDTAAEPASLLGGTGGADAGSQGMGNPLLPPVAK
jgi:hypothetical protein